MSVHLAFSLCPVCWLFFWSVGASPKATGAFHYLFFCSASVVFDLLLRGIVLRKVCFNS